MFIFRRFLSNQTECTEKWQISWVVDVIDSTAKELEKTLLDFENVGRVCLDCKSKLHLNSKQRTGKKWVFPIGEEKQKQKTKTKKQTSQFEELFTLCSKTHWQRRWKWDSNLDLGVMGQRQEKLDLGLDFRMLTVEMRSDHREAQPWMFWGVDGDEECRGLVFYWGNKRDIRRWVMKRYMEFSVQIKKKKKIRTYVQIFLQK